ncbi:unnamed protein product [Cochlearia groenlandica]
MMFKNCTSFCKKNKLDSWAWMDIKDHSVLTSKARAQTTGLHLHDSTHCAADYDQCEIKMKHLASTTDNSCSGDKQEIFLSQKETKRLYNALASVHFIIPMPPSISTSPIPVSSADFFNIHSELSHVLREQLLYCVSACF